MPIQLEGGTKQAVPKANSTKATDQDFICSSDDVKTEDGSEGSREGRADGWNIDPWDARRNLGYVDGKDFTSGGSFSRFDVKLRTSWQKACVERKDLSTRWFKSSRLLCGIWSKIQSAHQKVRTREFLLKGLALFTRDVYNFRQRIQYE